MCGIFGAINTTGFFDGPDFDRFVALTNLVAYRGPDDCGHVALILKESDSRQERRFDVFFGHRRLSIIDLSSAGHQPMSDGKGCWITYNGEIFNYLELRRELEARGHAFETGTDTEVILRVYREYGERGFDRLNGMWAFAIVDSRARKVVLSRDRFSIKPLYLFKSNSALYFGSEIKQLLPLLPSRELNASVMTAYLAQGLLDHDVETFFRGITRVPPGTNVIVSLDSGAVEERNYWSFESRGKTSASSKDLVEEFRSLFFDSVRIRLRSDVKVGVLLSGGLDSSAVTTAVKLVCGEQLQTYSIVSDEGYDERRFIDMMAATGVPNRKVTFRVGNVLDCLEQVLYYSDEPFAGFSVIAQHQLFAAIKHDSDVTVLLSGQGGDETLLGYLKFFFFHVQLLLKAGKYLDAMLLLARSSLHRTAVTQFQMSEARRYMQRNRRGIWQTMLRKSEPVPVWQCGDMRSRQIADIRNYSVPALTHYEDRNSGAHSLEVRHPFLDHRLVNFVVNLPTELKIHQGWTKYILRAALPEMPAALRWRRDKQGFLVPEQLWLKRELVQVIQQRFQGSTLAALDILNDKKFLLYYDQFLTRNSITSSDIARVLIAEIWAEKVFHSAVVPPLYIRSQTCQPPLVRNVVTA
ncbi:MAG: asparagine synthase (glutamine-hydrolyzing) [Acidobacteria bacterium]|nr:MAG: asparagine synthase (glutamine-hydrolyzing) [Acidobacteriota bacterium]